jgi:hypothetical protein
MKANSKSEIAGVGPQQDFQLLHCNDVFHDTIACKLSHRHGVIVSWFWKSTHGDITISDSLDLEYSAHQGDTIKGSKNSLEKSKDLRWFSNRRPSGETFHIGKHDCMIWKKDYRKDERSLDDSH